MLKVGGNDKAAIKRNGLTGFTITQDEITYSAYGIQYNIELTPTATTTWIGAYDSGEYVDEIRTLGTVDAIISTDAIDSTLTFSWQGELEAGEEKTLVSVFSVSIAEKINLNFYKYGSETEKVEGDHYALAGATFYTPKSTESEEGYTYEWNTRFDGTGRTYKAGSPALYDGNVDFYEVRRSNKIQIEELEESSGIVSMSDEFKNAYKDLKNSTKGDLYWYLSIGVDDVGDEISEYESLFPEGYAALATYEADLLYEYINYNSIGSTYDYDYTLIRKTPKKLKAGIYVDDFPEEITGLKILQIAEDETKSIINAKYDKNLGMIVFDTDTFYWGIILGTELPINPDTGINYDLYVTMFTISLLGLVGLGVYYKKKLS